MKVGELKEILKNVPDGYDVISALDSAMLEDVEVDDEEQIVYIYTEDM